MKLIGLLHPSAFILHPSMSSSSGIRTHSISGSKPKWSANCLPSRICRQCPEQESNLQSSGFKPDRSAGLAYLGIRRHHTPKDEHLSLRARLLESDGYLSSPGGTRTPDRLLVRELPLPLGHRTEIVFS